MNDTTMGARIAQRRREQGMTQEALAQLLGVSNQAVSKWESNICCPDIQLLPRLCDALEMTLDALFGREAPQPPCDLPDLPVSASFPWPDNNDLHAVLFQGHRLLRGGERFRQEYDAVRKTVTLHFTGTVDDIISDFSITCTDTTVRGDIHAGQSITCTGVGGDAKAGQALTCTTVDGDVQAGASVQCRDVHGDVRAGQSVTCGSVGGDVQAVSTVQCGDVGGDIRAGQSVTCGDVQGDIHAITVHRS